jgi:hypothetical protein
MLNICKKSLTNSWYYHQWAARDPVREAELPPGHDREGAAEGHHQVLLQDRRHRGGRRRESLALGRRHHHQSKGEADKQNYIRSLHVYPHWSFS